MFYIATTLHVLSVTLWVGGMFFAYMVLRPVAATQLEPPARLTLWSNIFKRFFPWVWISIGLILLTGFWMISSVFGGFASLPIYIKLMMYMGFGMMFIFLHVFFAPYRRLKQAVESQDWPTGGKKLAQIRILIGINVILGLCTIGMAMGGKALG